MITMYVLTQIWSRSMSLPDQSGLTRSHMWSSHVVHGDGISKETASQGAGIYTCIYICIYMNKYEIMTLTMHGR